MEKEIIEDGRFSIRKEGNTTTLAVKDVTFDDSDKYTVKVRNSLSAHSTFASFAVEGIPESPAGKPNLSDVTKTSVTVSWYGPAYDGGRAVTGYMVEGRKIGSLEWSTLVNSSHSTSFKAENLEKGAQFEFRVRAENVHGISEPSKSSNPITLDDLSDSLSELSEDEGEVSISPLNLGKVSLESGELFEQQFEQHEEVGKGRFGVVYRVSEKPTGARRAAKLIKCIRKEERQKVKEEITIMNALRHPKLLQLLAAFERKRDCVMIMEFISGGELFERVVADDFTLTERDCILFVRQICEGVAYMHSNSIVHLDLKPENILCVRRSSHQVKLIDFGLARRLDPNEECRVLFGTPEFVAPEVINYEPISFASDMWSVGVICYVLLSGLSPFMGENDAETFANITRAEFDFDDESFDAISSDAKDFINRMLDKRKEKRLNATDCLRCGWLAQSERSMKKVALSTDKLKRFIIRRKWQKTGNAIRALGRMANLTNLRNSSPTRLSTLPENTTASPLNLSCSLNQKLPPPSQSSPSKSSSGTVNERSDSGISECSSGIEDYPSRHSSSSLHSLIKDHNSGPPGSEPNGLSNTFPGALEKSGGKTDRLNWQSSVDSAVEEEVIGNSFDVTTPGPKLSNGSLLPSQATSCHRIDTHSRV